MKLTVFITEILVNFCIPHKEQVIIMQSNYETILLLLQPDNYCYQILSRDIIILITITDH